ncbi:MAG: T9SS type A sorting domain-containing protein [Candidatus Krumholzibacteriia bacterium]
MNVMKSIGLAAVATLLACASPVYSQTTIAYTIHWAQVSDPSANRVLVYRSVTSNLADFVPIGSVAVSDTSYVDADGALDNDTRYHYSLRSQTAAGTLGLFSAMVSGLTISEAASESLKSQCRIDSIITIDSATCRVHWSTAAPTTGKVRYWQLGTTTVLESASTTTLATQHAMVIGGLSKNQIYFARAVSHDAAGASLTISASQGFTTSPPVSEFAIVTSADTIDVPENGTAELGVKLSAQPPGAVEVTLVRSSGDADLSVQSGSVLSFTTSNWDAYQTATFAAANDADVENGSADVIVYVSAGASAPLRTIKLVENDDDVLAFVLDQSTLAVPEAGTAQFHVRLGNQPPSSVSALVSRSSGDGDISVQSGGSLIFTTSNWDVDQTVTLAAAVDIDVANGAAAILVHGTSGPAVPDVTLVAMEIDDDALYFVLDSDTVVVVEGSTAQFRVRLGNQPPANVSVSVSRLSGDEDISVQSGASLVFTTSNWNADQTVVLAAAQDDDSRDGTATILVRAISGASVSDAALIAREDDDEPGDRGNLMVSASIRIYPMPYRPDRGVLKLISLPEDGSIAIYDLAGRKIQDITWSGTETTWNGKNTAASDVASGRYFLLIRNAAGRVVEKQAILVVR